jgi:hypothetical protein
MLKDSIRTGEASSTAANERGSGNGIYKFENTARIYLNDSISENFSWHGELNITNDSKAIDAFDGHENHTQRDWLRELYLDTSFGDWDLRIGKQQVVWGTADGIKLLDNINPTDWSEFNQNTMADARIPVWMINAEKYLENGDNIQLIASQAESNKIAGLNTESKKATSHTISDSGHPFIMKGVDTITGKVNGFLNIGGAMGKVAAFFDAAAGQSSSTADAFSGGLANYSGATVNEFVNGAVDAGDFAGLTVTGCSGTTSATCLYHTANSTAAGTNGFTAHAMGSNSDVTNLIDDDGTFDENNPNTIFEFMGETSFATFTDFVAMKTAYRVHKDQLKDANLAMRYKGSMDNGLNYSFNIANKEDSNPYVNVHWEDTNGAQLNARYSSGTGYGLQVGGDAATVVSLYEGSTAWNPDVTKQAVLVFDEQTNRINTLGGSFDTSLDTGASPIVMRGEFIYEKGVMTPIINRAKLKVGDVVGALTTEKADFFKYVIGADTTIFTDMMLSGQFIQFRNLDFVDETVTTITDGAGNSATVSGTRYTGDSAAMHLSNGLQKATKNKEFYSLFMSKPFGESGEGRWNNIFIFEEGGGKWNRFDVEYGINDQLIGTIEYNKYFGDENTMFGQFANSSNVQIGVKYLLQ